MGRTDITSSAGPRRRGWTRVDKGGGGEVKVREGKERGEPQMPATASDPGVQPPVCADPSMTMRQSGSTGRLDRRDVAQEQRANSQAGTRHPSMAERPTGIYQHHSRHLLPLTTSRFVQPCLPSDRYRPDTPLEQV